MTPYNVGILGATGMVGQRLLSLLEDHPWFHVKALAASRRSVGQRYADAVRFSLMVLTFWSTKIYWDQASWFYWALGGAMAGCARFYRERFPMLFHIYTSMATAFVTLGIITFFSGNAMYLVLVVESGVLLVTAYRTGLRVMRYGSVAVSFIAAGSLVYYFADNFSRVTWDSWPFAAGCPGGGAPPPAG